MPRKHVFADESGNFDFSRKAGASRYFIVTTLVCEPALLTTALMDLRRELAWERLGLNSEFHATTDEQAVRDRVFDVLCSHDFRVDTTILEKAKAQPQTRTTDERFFQTGYYLHLKYVIPRAAQPSDELMVVGASLGTKKKRMAFHEAVKDVVQQVTRTSRYRTASWRDDSDPCLQAVDYCCWAIARKWEAGDTRSYERIRDRVHSEFDVWRRATVFYY